MRAKPNAATTPITIKISLLELKNLAKLAYAEHITRSQYARRAISDRINFEIHAGNPILLEPEQITEQQAPEEPETESYTNTDENLSSTPTTEAISHEGTENKHERRD